MSAPDKIYVPASKFNTELGQTAWAMKSSRDDIEYSLSEWQPIETAPKDGTEIFVCGRCQKPSIDAGKAVRTIAYWTEHNGGGWVWHGAAMHFTKWMPLPELPETI